MILYCINTRVINKASAGNGSPLAFMALLYLWQSFNICKNNSLSAEHNISAKPFHDSISRIRMSSSGNKLIVPTFKLDLFLQILYQFNTIETIFCNVEIRWTLK